MTQRDEKYIDVRVVELGHEPETWRYEHDSDYVKAERWKDGTVRLEVGFQGISEEGAHSIKMPPAIVDALAAWLGRFRRGS